MINEDAVTACVDLVGRCGASGFEMAWTCPHVPDDEDGHTCPDVTWNASAAFQGARIMVAERHTPTEAAMALAERLLAGAACRCRQPVVLSDGKQGCRWRLMGARWEPGCDAEPLHINGPRGDHAAMEQALAEQPTRRERRAKGRRR